MHSQWPLWFAGQFKCAVERIKWVNAGPLRAVKTKQKIPVCLYYQPLCLSLSLSAVYLCKRTMQNKARLELADYEAVSERGLLVSAILSSHICSAPVLPPLSGFISCVFLFILKLGTFVFFCFFSVTASFVLFFSPKLLNEPMGWLSFFFLCASRDH